jgi:hypothetical protein
MKLSWAGYPLLAGFHVLPNLNLFESKYVLLAYCNAMLV